MARRQDDESAISLFSFQDIITSLTGIMFLVVLLLVLIMLSSRKPAVAEVNADPQSRELQKQVEQLKKELSELQQERSLMDDELTELRKMTPEALEQRKEELHLQIRQTLEAINRKKVYMEQKIRELEEQKQLLEQTRQQNKQQQQKKADLEKQLSDLQKKLEQLNKQKEQQARMMSYTIERHYSKAPLLMEVSQDGIRIFVVDAQQLHDFRQPGNFEKSFSNTCKFLNNLSPSSYYISAIFKPNAFKYTEQLSTYFSQKGFERGIEIMPDNDTSLFEEKMP